MTVEVEEALQTELQLIQVNINCVIIVEPWPYRHFGNNSNRVTLSYLNPRAKFYCWGGT